MAVIAASFRGRFLVFVVVFILRVVAAAAAVVVAVAGGEAREPAVAMEDALRDGAKAAADAGHGAERLGVEVDGTEHQRQDVLVQDPRVHVAAPRCRGPNAAAVAVARASSAAAPGRAAARRAEEPPGRRQRWQRRVGEAERAGEGEVPGGTERREIYTRAAGRAAATSRAPRKARVSEQGKTGRWGGVVAPAVARQLDHSGVERQ
nr:unnamed protein product [Digitaria exilis]